MENKITNIKDRVMQIAKKQSISNEKFFSDIGMTSANFRGVANKRPLNSNAIEIIITKYPSVDPEWLLTGEGTMLRHKEKAIKINHEDPDYLTRGIPLIPLKAMAGIGAGEISVMELDCERYVVPAFNGADYLIPVKGSSMVPKYSSGDIVACKKITMTDIFFQWNKVYVLDTVQGPIIKRVERGKDEKHLLMISENEKYKPFELSLKQINAVAIVIGVIRLE